LITAYLDSSAIVKRYVLENGSDIVSETYERSLNGELALAISAWNIGEVLGVLDKYLNRRWLSKDDYRSAKLQFIGETLKLLRLKTLRIIPVKTKILIQAWRLIEEHHIYEADAIQIISAETVGAGEFYTGDEKLHKIAVKEGLNSIYLS